METNTDCDTEYITIDDIVYYDKTEYEPFRDLLKNLRLPKKNSTYHSAACWKIFSFDAARLECEREGSFLFCIDLFCNRENNESYVCITPKDSFSLNLAMNIFSTTNCNTLLAIHPNFYPNNNNKIISQGFNLVDACDCFSSKTYCDNAYHIVNDNVSEALIIYLRTQNFRTKSARKVLG